MRILTASSWTLFSISATPPPHNAGISHIIADAIDSTRVPVHRLRPLASWWVTWAGKRLHLLFDVWKREVDAL